MSQSHCEICKMKKGLSELIFYPDFYAAYSTVVCKDCLKIYQKNGGDIMKDKLQEIESLIRKIKFISNGNPKYKIEENINVVLEQLKIAFQMCLKTHNDLIDEGKS